MACRFFFRAHSCTPFDSTIPRLERARRNCSLALPAHKIPSSLASIAIMSHFIVEQGAREVLSTANPCSTGSLASPPPLECPAPSSDVSSSESDLESFPDNLDQTLDEQPYKQQDDQQQHTQAGVAPAALGVPPRDALAASLHYPILLTPDPVPGVSVTACAQEGLPINNGR